MCTSRAADLLSFFAVRSFGFSHSFCQFRRRRRRRRHRHRHHCVLLVCRALFFHVWWGKFRFIVFFLFFIYSINIKGRMERMQCGPISQLISHLSVIKLTVFKYSSTVLQKHKFNKTHFFSYICLVWCIYISSKPCNTWTVFLLRYRHSLVFTTTHFHLFSFFGLKIPSKKCITCLCVCVCVCLHTHSLRTTIQKQQ